MIGNKWVNVVIWYLEILCSASNVTTIKAKKSHDNAVGIMVLLKNEEKSMQEWMLHYILEGVTQFTMIDHQSTDHPKHVIQAVAKRHPRIEIQHVHWDEPRSIHTQGDAYRHFINPL